MNTYNIERKHMPYLIPLNEAILWPPVAVDPLIPILATAIDSLLACFFVVC